MTTTGKDFPVRSDAFRFRSETRASSAATSPACTECFDIFPAKPGDSDVINQMERLSSKEMKIAARLVWMAVGASCRSATVGMLVSRVGVRNLTLPERWSLSTSPWDLVADEALVALLQLPFERGQDGGPGGGVLLHLVAIATDDVAPPGQRHGLGLVFDVLLDWPRALGRHVREADRRSVRPSGRDRRPACQYAQGEAGGRHRRTRGGLQRQPLLPPV